MSPRIHRIYVSTLIAIVAATTLFLAVSGYNYYSTGLEQRFYHPDHDLYKPSGIFGHGMGILGTLLILIGVTSYIARKRYKFLARFGRLKYWLEFHIFLCSLGPVLVLFHTAFKFHGIVSIAFWSMVAVVASGIIGRFIYIQIPRTIEGRELSLNEVRQMKTDIGQVLEGSGQMENSRLKAILESVEKSVNNGKGNLLARIVKKHLEDRRTIRTVKELLRQGGLPGADVRRIARAVGSELSLNNRIERLQTMQNLFKYWHVAHLPFALIMLVIAVIHVGIALAFGYTWKF